jgi:hypothetical protein
MASFIIYFNQSLTILKTLSSIQHPSSTSIQHARSSSSSSSSSNSRFVTLTSYN